MYHRFADYVVPDLVRWHQQGQRAALLTLINVEPSGPRPEGSQMAVSETGEAVGFLSGGCVEAALVEEALAAFEAGRNRIVRYGEGSPYFDIELPCGSAVDIYVDVGVEPDIVAGIDAAGRERRPVRLITETESGAHKLLDGTGNLADDERPVLLRDEVAFDRLYRPALHLMVAGKGPVIAAVTQIARAAGIEVTAICAEDATAELARAAGAEVRRTLGNLSPDRWTAVATLFHEHELEIPVLEAAMRSDAFYIGALGSSKVQRERVARFHAEGWDEDLVKRIHGPMGLDIGSKSPPEIALSLLGEVIQEHHGRFPA